MWRLVFNLFTLLIKLRGVTDSSEGSVNKQSFHPEDKIVSQNTTYVGQQKDMCSLACPMWIKGWTVFVYVILSSFVAVQA